MADEQSAEEINEAIFISGTKETSDVPVIYIDPSELGGFFDNSDKELIEQLESQIPGSADAMLNRVREAESNQNITFTDIAQAAKIKGPFAINSITIGDQEYCVVNKPDNTLDTKEEYINALIYGLYDEETIQDIISNLPINDADMNKIFGRHEGVHCNQEPVIHKHDLLGGEGEADQITLDRFKNDGQDDEALAFKDIRYLATHDSGHSTGVLLDSGDKASLAHFAIAEILKNQMDGEVNKHHPWLENMLHYNSTTNATNILKHDPEGYFKIINIGLEELEIQVTEALENDLSDGNIEMVIMAQITIDSAKGFEDAYRRRALGQDIPDNREPTQLLPQEVEDEYYAREDIQIKIIEKRSKTEAEWQEAEQKHSPSADAGKGYEPGKDGTPYTTEVRGIPTGLVEVDFKNGVSVGTDKTPITHAFDQSANPAPEDIEVVNAKTPPITEIIPPIPTANNSEYSTQSYA